MSDLIKINRKTKSYNSGHIEIIITKSSLYDTRILFDLSTSDEQYLASIAWVATAIQNGENVMQPAIINQEPKNTYLSYDGQNNYLDGYDSIMMPSNGSLYKMNQLKMNYFNNINPELYNKRYSLLYNNNSIRMNNISLFNEDFSKGIMMDFRASLEGTFSDSAKNGYIVILAAIDPIN